MKYFPLAFLLALVGCAQAPISANPIQSTVTAVVPQQVQQTVQTDLLSAEWNLDQAIAVGALAPDDPADKCLHGALTQIGIEPPPPGTTPTVPPSFAPKNDGLVSLGAVLYVRFQQLKKLQGGGSLTIPTDCKALVGQFVLDAGAAGIKGLPGGSLIPTLQ